MEIYHARFTTGRVGSGHKKSGATVVNMRHSKWGAREKGASNGVGFKDVCHHVLLSKMYVAQVKDYV